MQPDPENASREQARTWEMFCFPWGSEGPNAVKEKYLERRLMDWNDCLSKYWAELPSIQVDLDRDREEEKRFRKKVRPSAYDDPSVDLPLLPDAEGIKYRRDMENQRIARRGHEFYGFLHLPPEVRMIIYDYLLVVGDVFVPNSYYEDHSFIEPGLPAVEHLKTAQLYKPSQEFYYRYRNYSYSIVPKDTLDRYTPGLIMGVSDSVQREATKTFWNQNRFIYPYGLPGTSLRFFVGLLVYKNDCMHLVRDLSYTFDMREGSREPYSDYSGPALELRVNRNLLPSEYRNTPGMLQERQESIHLDQISNLKEAWFSIAHGIRQKTNLRRLQLDLEECYCPLSCCRMVDFVCSLFSGEWAIAVPEVIEILGWFDEDEKNYITRSLSVLNGVENADRIVFVGPATKIPSSEPSTPII